MQKVHIYFNQKWENYKLRDFCWYFFTEKSKSGKDDT